jgi:hypothetical protein
VPLQGTFRVSEFHDVDGCSSKQHAEIRIDEGATSTHFFQRVSQLALMNKK